MSQQESRSTASTLETLATESQAWKAKQWDALLARVEEIQLMSGPAETVLAIDADWCYRITACDSATANTAINMEPREDS